MIYSPNCSQSFTKYQIMELLKIISSWLSPTFYITFGRGCPHICSFCAGGYNLRNILHRREPILKSTEAILKDVEQFYISGIKHFVSAFYYDKYQNILTQFFTEIAKNFKGIAINQDICCDLPSEELIDAFKLMDKKSTLFFLVYSLSEKQRSLNMHKNFANKELINKIKFAQKYGVKIRLILSSGLPFEDEDTIKETKSMIKIIKKINPDILAYSIPSELSPGSPMHLQPNKYYEILCNP